MKINFLELEPVGETREISKIPAKEDDDKQIDFDAFGGIITFSRRDIVSDLLKVYLKFCAECNLMSNRGGETVDAKLAHDFQEISFGNKDLHPRITGYAFFSMASNIVGNWEDRYMKLCEEAAKKEQENKKDEEEIQEQKNDSENYLFSPTQQEPPLTEIEISSCTETELENP